MKKETREEALAHAKYEYDMARFCINELAKENPQALWNAMLAAFAVYFRNCRDFLTNAGDQNAIKARQYVPKDQFKAGSAEKLKDELQQLHDEIVHLSSKRTSKDEQKLGLEGALKLMSWLRENMDEFIGKLGDDDRRRWDDNFGYRPTSNEVAKGYTGPAQSSNHIIFEQRTHSTLININEVIDLSFRLKK